MADCAFGIIKNKRDEILLVRIAPPFAESGKWNFPGGVVEEGESNEAGLLREINEETNLKCIVLGRKDSFTTQDGRDEINIYSALYVSGDIKIQESEILQAKWYSTKDALDLVLAFNIRDYISQSNF